LVFFDLAFWLAGASLIAHAGIAAAALHATWQLRHFEANDPMRCLEIFRSNRIFGLIIVGSLLLDILIP
ncbi:MAG: 4-hydroxybenzoate octaprenyltransferase, partial [Aestuariivirga sp.]